MAVQILSQSYGPRKPLIECTADSLSDLAGLVCAEGSKATVGGTEYVLDRVNGWVEPGSGGGGGGGGGAFIVNLTMADGLFVADKTCGEILSASKTRPVIFIDGTYDGAYLLTDSEFNDGDGYKFYFLAPWAGEGKFITLAGSASTDHPTQSP